MRHRLSAWIFVLTCTCLSASAMADVTDLSSRVRELKLSNGLTCLLVERHLSPTVSFHIFFPVGSVDDEPGRTGLAHLFEHMMFKGTKTVGVTDAAAEAKILDRMDRVVEEIQKKEKNPSAPPRASLDALKAEFRRLSAEEEKLVIPGEYWKIYERAGAEDMNAGTGADFTEYSVSLPSNKIELWMAMESDRLRNAVVREFYKERSVVMEERRLRVDTSPSGKLWEVFLHAAFGSYPYGEPVVGRMEDVSQLTRPEAIRFFRAHYLLSKGVLSIVGDFSTETVETMLKKYFGKSVIPAEAGIQSLDARSTHLGHDGHPSIDREIRVAVPFDAEPEVLIGYLEPAIGSSDDAALEAVSDILGLGRTSRLNQSLVEARRVAQGVGVSTGNPGEREENLFTFDVVPRSPHTADECVRAVDAEIARLQKTPPEAWELEKVKNNLEASLLNSMASNTGLSWRLGYYQAMTGDWRYLSSLLEKIRALTAADVTRAARTYLDPKHRVIAVRVRKEGS